MAKKFYTTDGKAVPEGSAEAAFMFKDGSPQLEAFQKSLKGQSAKPAAAKADAEDDGSVERVSKAK